MIVTKIVTHDDKEYISAVKSFIVQAAGQWPVLYTYYDRK